MQILIVEDNASIAKLMVEYLEEAGHVVIGPAATAEAALGLCQRHIPDLAILDIDLQDGSSGVEVARALFSRWGLVTVFASGEIMAARQARDIALGYLQKPYEMRALLQGVAAIEAMRADEAPLPVPRSFEAFPHPEAGWTPRKLPAAASL